MTEPNFPAEGWQFPESRVRRCPGALSAPGDREQIPQLPPVLERSPRHERFPMNCSGDKLLALAFQTNLYLNLHMCIFCVALKKTESGVC